MASTSPALMLDGSLGAIEIGVIIAIFLYGIQTLQTFNYHSDFPKDSRLLKTTVAVVWLLELGHTTCICHALYFMTIKFYGHPEHIGSPPISLILTDLFTPIISIIVQTFFALRVRVVSKRWPIPILCFVLNFVRFVANIGFVVKLLQHPEFSYAVTTLHWLVTLANSIAPAVDIIIAGSLCYFLWQVRDSEFHHTKRMVDTIILWTLETTLATSLAGLMTLILFLTRDDLAWFVFYTIQAKVFSNSLLASLNGRKRLRTHQQPTNIPSSHFIGLESTAPARDPELVIRMQRMTTTDRDIIKDAVSAI
ncbi:hypothetical protein C8R44DRAFT_817719 [Mycena epipterygia]|nr:hypothetical protein C8R44DRAFT_817719 [Mycena epipterygia]